MTLGGQTVKKTLRLLASVYLNLSSTESQRKSTQVHASRRKSTQVGGSSEGFVVITLLLIDVSELSRARASRPVHLAQYVGHI